ncbi:hypothetical protein [Tepidibacter aestuarii]|uniref:hypothetical protein n=1 Tax=Tepidibacter aestuarii TaxID=2925782 RepID=UPI0020C02327|nr:hypothetical protein [Tepidibacter aestuarii]CAH2212068.1 conserved protein of unknown function [Tepidibacter aestuarii]
MKKYSFLIAFTLLLFLTFLSYSYQRENYEDVIKPHVNIESKKLGKITNIDFCKTYKNPCLVITSTKYEDDVPYSYIYLLDLNTDEITQLNKYKSHKYLNDFLTFDSFASDDIITACNYGVVQTEVRYDDDGLIKFNSEKQDIFKFENADSMDFKNGSLFFSSKDDDLIYKQTLHNDFFSSFTNNNAPKHQTFYKKPLYIVNANSLDNCLSYTKINKDKLDLYRMYYSGEYIDKFNGPLIKNIVNARGLYNGNGFIGMNINSNSKLNIFMNRNQRKDQDNYKIDTIDYNTDMFGAVPSIDSLTFNEDYTLIYTSYDENHKGKIQSVGYNKNIETVLEDENLYGPVRIEDFRIDDNKIKKIMYFTYENGSAKVNICDINGNKIKSIIL